MSATHGASVARAEAPTLDLGIAGGSMIPWESLDTIGNAFAGVVGLRFGAFKVGLGFGSVLPDARAQGQLGAFWAEGMWFPLHVSSETGSETSWSPYALLGAGLVTDDGDPAPDPDGIEHVRWNTAGPDPLLTGGVGVRYGPTQGLYLSAELRQYNLSHAGLSLGAGWSF